MTTKHPPMPGADIFTRVKPVESEPRLRTLANRLVTDLADGHAAVKASIHDDSATIEIYYKGHGAEIDLHYSDGEGLVAVVYRSGAEPDRVNAPDRTLAAEVLASLRGAS